MAIVPDFNLGDHVTINPLENCPARVIALELDRDGWTVTVRYFQNGEAKQLKAFPDELAKIGQPQQDIQRKPSVNIGAWPGF